jgi:hypothetical protein
VSEAEQIEARWERRRSRRNSDSDSKPDSAPEEEEAGLYQSEYPSFTLARELSRPIGPRSQIARIRLYLPRNTGVHE